MANSGQVVIRDDYFYCTICLEIYDTPRSLPCLHSFCQACLKGYILKIKEKTGTQHLICPVCRADTKTDNVKFKQVQKWVEYFPINFTLLSILKERKLAMNPKGNDCEACLRENIKVDAIIYCYDCSEKLCDDCKRHHKKNKILANHKLIDTLDKQDSICDLADVEYLANLTKCPTHSTEEVKYLCKDHDQLCCNECAIVIHRKCEDIVSLNDEIKMMKEENNESNVQKRLNTVDSYVDRLIKHETAYLETINRKENDVNVRLVDLKSKLDAAYNNMKKRVLSEVLIRKEAFLKASSLQKDLVEKLKEDIKEAGQKLKKARTIGTSLHLFLLEREMCKQTSQYEETFTTLRDRSSKAAVALFEEKPPEEIMRKIEDMCKVEEVEEEQHLPTISLTKDFKNRKLSLELEVSLNKSEPRYCLWVGNNIVVSYLNWSYLEVYKEGDGLLLSTYRCHSSTSLTATENGEFAVALPSSNKINVMNISENQVVCLRQISCSKPDLIAYNRKDKHLLIFSRSEMVLRKITLTGSDAGSIDLRRLEKSYLENSLNLFVDSQQRHIFISSFNQHKLFCIDMSGNLIFQLEIAYPWSVITDSQGNVYVASFTKDFIQQFCPNGQLLKADIIGDDRNRHPMAMSFNNEMNKLAVTYSDSSKKMKIYKFL